MKWKMLRIVFTQKAWNELSGFSSRRIDNVNRLVYRIVDDCVEIIQCKGHYES